MSVERVILHYRHVGTRANAPTDLVSKHDVT
jgi:hypothetical protein